MTAASRHQELRNRRHGLMESIFGQGKQHGRRQLCKGATNARSSCSPMERQPLQALLLSRGSQALQIMVLLLARHRLSRGPAAHLQAILSL